MSLSTNNLISIVSFFDDFEALKMFTLINKKCRRVLFQLKENPISLTDHTALIFSTFEKQNIFTYEDEHFFGVTKFVYHCPVCYSYYNEMKGNRYIFKHVVYTSRDRRRFGDYVPRGVTDIGFDSFLMSEIQTLAIPTSVTSIQNNAFEKCSKLVSLELPSRLISLGAEAFMGCSSLTRLDTPKCLTFVGFSCFDGCSNLKNPPVVSNKII
ncbi:hypothetical protein EIN_185420 [Entamoeba invadens IP1]|uniref:hypothetical protein n=1 Tax=Entamoeba invadens IP1 TaxID=370355 RepID=UPI0002C3D37A|nr:hypothetical protein EIN_185420 [Entamoeba invadens IP1]ELP94155.1 hypothetical protein EIN_185420 [Entamoeba invadens IP1]|eukprot:XP_004260926.1 hypothetical protein EIN_185420 [Entamoeba invadens IP1]